MKIDRILTFVLLFIALSNVFPQIKIKELSEDQTLYPDSIIIGSSITRETIDLSENWLVYPPNYPEQKSKINIPSTFEGTNSLIYERNVYLTADEILNHRIVLIFLGLNYSVEISVNNLVLYRNQIGETPFTVELPSDVLIANSENKLNLKVDHNLDSETTIPIKQRFLFPINKGGILRNIFLQFLPKVFIEDARITTNLNARLNSAILSFKINMSDANNTRNILRETLPNFKFSIRIKIYNSNGEIQSSGFLLNNKLKNIQDSTSTYSIIIPNPSLWSPNTPTLYTADIQFLHGTTVLDQITKSFAIFNLEKQAANILLNSTRFTVKGVNYIASSNEFGNLIPYSKLEKDISFIKDLGFNTIRFSKAVPPPEALRLCSEKGLFAFIEIPLNSIDDESLKRDEFKIRAKEYIQHFCNYFDQYPSVAAIGLGSSYLSNSNIQTTFIKELTSLVDQISNKFTYASFIGIPQTEIDNLDFYGIELYSKPLSDYITQYEQYAATIGKENIFISEATYPTFNGSTNGYLTPNSFESQAKYFNDLLAEITKNNMNLYFLGSIFDYPGDFSSLYCGFSDENLYRIGITDQDYNTNRLSYKVIHSSFFQESKVTIPIGNKKNDSPLLFILTSLVLSVILALLINSKRKFREDSTRALLRPYNFFADVRDHRIISGLHTAILMFIVAASISILITILLYFFRSNIFLDRILLSFGSISFAQTVGYFSWHPYQSFAYLFLLVIILFFVTSLILKVISFSLKHKVYYLSIFYVLVWSFLPFTLLLPVELILYKLLNADIINVYLYLFLIVYSLWILQRLLKGIYIIFDVSPLRVYFYGLLLLAIVLCGILLYFQITESSLFHILNAVKQYQLI